MRETRAARRPVVNAAAQRADESAEALRRTAAIEAGRARQAAWKAERTNTNQETPVPTTPTTGSIPVISMPEAAAAARQ